MHISSYNERKPSNDSEKEHFQTPISAPLATPTAALPTQMIIFPIKATATIEDASSADGRIWAQVLDIFEAWTGFRRLYWGRHLEEPTKTQLHIVRDSLNHHYSLLSSPQWTQITTLVASISEPDSSSSSPSSSPNPSTTVRHAMIADFTSKPKALGKGAPVTGTAIYLATDPEGWEKTWALWTTLVPNVKGCLGCTGGWVVEPVDGHERSYVVWVGWESTELHDRYHYTKDFAKKRVILQQHNSGWREYGHVLFKYSRGGREANL